MKRALSLVLLVITAKAMQPLTPIKIIKESSSPTVPFKLDEKIKKIRAKDIELKIQKGSLIVEEKNEFLQIYKNILSGLRLFSMEDNLYNAQQLDDSFIEMDQHAIALANKIYTELTPEIEMTKRVASSNSHYNPQHWRTFREFTITRIQTKLSENTSLRFSKEEGMEGYFALNKDLNLNSENMSAVLTELMLIYIPLQIQRNEVRK